MDPAIASIVLALVFALAIIVGIIAFTIRRYRAAAPEQRVQIKESYKRSAQMAGIVLIVLGVISTSLEPAQSGIWWFDMGSIVLGALVLIAGFVGIPDWVVREQ